MASMAKGYNARYLVAKAWHAVEELVAEFAQTSSATAGLAASARRAASAASSSASSASAAQAPGASASSPGADFFSLAMRRLQTSWESKLTLPIYMAGAAMAPALNKAALKDRDALEKLVVRCIARPSARSVFVGDVVAFTSPLTPSKDDVSNVLVRRVAAVDGDELVAPSADGKDDEEEVMEVPKGHCWVLADNSDLRPPQVRLREGRGGACTPGARWRGATRVLACGGRQARDERGTLLRCGACCTPPRR